MNEWERYGNITEEEYNRFYELCSMMSQAGMGWHLDDLLRVVSEGRYESERHFEERRKLLWNVYYPPEAREKVRNLVVM